MFYLGGVSKHWNPGGKATALGGSRIRREPARPSRIRREPIRLEKKEPVYSEEREIAVGVIGIVLMAAALAVVILGISIFTIVKSDPMAAAADAVKFGQCYNSDGSNCVLTGDTIYVDHQRVQIAGIEAPGINAAACRKERDRGIDAAVGLSGLLQSGEVTVNPIFRDEYGRAVSKVQVNGRDVADYMTSHSFVRAYTGEKQKWCS